MDTGKNDVVEFLLKIRREGYQEGYDKAKENEKATQAFSFLQSKCVNKFISQEYIERKQKEEAAMMIGKFIIDNDLCKIIDLELIEGRPARKFIVEVVKPEERSDEK